MITRMLVTAVAVVVALGVAAAAAYAWYVRTPSLDAPPLPADVTTGSIRVDGFDRSYTAVTPHDLPARPRLLLVFHGNGQSGEQVRELTGFGFDAMAAETGSIVIYPEAYEGSWNDCRSAATSAARNAGVDDVALAAAIVDRLVVERRVDPSGVFAAGFSNGGQLVHRLAAEDPDRYAGLAGIAATRPADANWRCATEPASVPRLFIHGTDDRVAPYDGGRFTLFGRDLGTALSVADSAARAAATNGITSAPRSEALGRDGNGDPAVHQQRWAAPGQDPVLVLTAIGGGHTMPSAVTRGPRVFGATSAAMDTPTEVWRFFDGLADSP